MKVNKGNPAIMGCNKIGDSYNFSVVSKESQIALLIFDATKREKKRIELDEKKKVGNTFSVVLSGENLDDALYCYEINGEMYIDPYAKAITDCDAFGVVKDNAKYLSPVTIKCFDWEGDEPLNLEYKDCIIYKMNVRGFTKSKTCKVKNKGTFEGIVEMIPYMKELGITSIELQPAYEFDDSRRFPQFDEDILNRYAPDKQYMVNTKERKVNYWGYVGGFYFAPKAAYSKSAAAGNKSFVDYTVEFKKMVKELHKNGIEVIMEMFFEKENTSYIIECVKYWVLEYHIDGVHVYCEESVLKALTEEAVLSNTKIITVYWGGNTGDRKHIANYNNDFQNIARRFLKGDENMLNAYIAVSKRNDNNSASINYIANNNGFTLLDLVSYDRKHNEANGENNRDGENFNYSWNCGEEGPTRKRKINDLRIKQIKNALMMVILSGGTPLLLAGDELGNSQNGNNNPYCVDSEISWVNWKDNKLSKEILSYTKKLIEYRKNNEILHMKEALVSSDRLSCGYPDISYHGSSAWYSQMQTFDRHMGVLFSCVYGKDEDYRLIYVGYNMHWENHELALPKVDGGEWNVIMHSSKEKPIIDEDSRKVTVYPRSIVVVECSYTPNIKKETKTNKRTKKAKK